MWPHAEIQQPAAPIFRLKEENSMFLWTVNFYQTVLYHNPESSILYRITRFKCRTVIDHCIFSTKEHKILIRNR